MSEAEGGAEKVALFLTKTDVVVNGALDGLAARHRVYANNVANIETPGFLPGEVPFEDQLRKIRDQIAEEPASIASAPRLSLEPVLNDQGADRVDGNGVQADRQVMQLAESTLTYEALAQATKMRNELLRSIITEGKR
jgi:flagellar basal-body rod protein FlgB